MKINVGGGCDKFGRRRRAGWREKIRWALLDPSGAYRAAYQRALPQAVQIADPFHVVRLANLCLDRVRRRAQEETLGHRGRKHGRPLPGYANSSPSPANDSTPAANKNWAASSKQATPGEVRDAWHANETVRVIYQTSHPGEGDEYTRLLAVELQDQSCSPELNQLGRTLHTWHSQIVAWHHARVGNGPTESANNLIKRVKRVAFGFRNFRNYRTRILLYAGKPTRTYTTPSPPPPKKINFRRAN